MDSNELMLDNMLVEKGTKRILRVCELTEGRIAFPGDLRGRSDFEAIKLTDEIINKCEIYDDRFRVNFSKDVSGYFIWFNGYKIYIKFLHSLQNFYYMVSNTQLKVNM